MSERYRCFENDEGIHLGHIPRWELCDRGVPVKCHCLVTDKDEMTRLNKLAAALNAAEQAGRERELLAKAREIVCYVAAFVDNPGQESIAGAWLAEYAALQTEGE